MARIKHIEFAGIDGASLRDFYGALVFALIEDPKGNPVGLTQKV